jgi:hypothetical protein
MEVAMLKLALSLCLPVMFATIFMSSPADAASVEQVVAACDKMDAANPGSCNYTTDCCGLGGCTANGCFYCPADGSRQCHATRVGGGQTVKAGETNVAVQLGEIQLNCKVLDEGWCSRDTSQTGTQTGTPPAPSTAQ